MTSPDSVRMNIGCPDFTTCRKLAVKQVEHVQGERPSDQLTATAIALIAMAEAAHFDPYEIVSIGLRMMNSIEGPFTHQVQAIRDYAKSELSRL